MVATRDAIANDTSAAGGHQNVLLAANGMVYDAMGNLVEEIHADGGVVQYKWDAFGNRTRVRDAAGVVTDSTYDDMGRLLTQTKAQGINLATYHNASGVDGYAQDASAVALVDTYRYDELGRRLNTINALGQITTYKYDLRGNVLSSSDALGLTTTYTWDEFNRKKSQKESTGAQMQYTWDAWGHLKTQTDNDNTVHTYNYDNLKHLASVTSAGTTNGGQNLVYTYDDASGLLVKIEDKSLGVNGSNHAQEQVTQFAYDLAGRHTREKTSVLDLVTGVESDVTQDNHIMWDTLGRMTDVQDGRYVVHYDYDRNGNRVHLHTAYLQDSTAATGSDNAVVIDTYNAYDAMNRQTIVDGVQSGSSAAISHDANNNALGQQIFYDAAGNRVAMRQWTKRIMSDPGTDPNTGSPILVWGSVNGYSVESYSYDAAGRLTDVMKDGLDIDARKYDAAGRLIRSGLNPAMREAAGVLSIFGGAVLDSDEHVNTYAANGRITLQLTHTIGDGTHYVIYNYNVNDNRLQSYELQTPAGNSVYTYYYSTQDGNRVDRIKAYGWDSTANTYNHYDKNGYLTSVTTDGINNQNAQRTLFNDYAGRVLRNTQFDGHMTNTLIVNNEVIGSSSDAQAAVPDTFRSHYVPIDDTTLTNGPTAYTVQTGDTLQGIAKQLWGDANLWYVIADANGYTSIRAGQVITIPPKPNTVTNGSDFFNPYDPTKAVGNTTPQLPPPPAKENIFAEIAAAIIQILIIVMSDGAAAPQADAIGGTIGEGGMTVAEAGAEGSVGFVGPPTALANPTLVQQIASKAMIGAFANMAGQAVLIAGGVQKDLDFSGVAMAAIGGGVSAELSSFDAF